MRLRLTQTDLLELARLYRTEAVRQRREAGDRAHYTTHRHYIDAAKQADARATRLEDMARKGQYFILMPTRPFDGGPPSLLVVGGSDTTDGTAFLIRKSRK